MWPASQLRSRAWVQKRELESPACRHTTKARAEKRELAYLVQLACHSVQYFLLSSFLANLSTLRENLAVVSWPKPLNGCARKSLSGGPGQAGTEKMYKGRYRLSPAHLEKDGFSGLRESLPGEAAHAGAPPAPSMAGARVGGGMLGSISPVCPSLRSPGGCLRNGVKTPGEKTLRCQAGPWKKAIWGRELILNWPSLSGSCSAHPTKADLLLQLRCGRDACG